jgi:hypothetical protein
MYMCTGTQSGDAVPCAAAEAGVQVQYEHTARGRGVAALPLVRRRFRG